MSSKQASLHIEHGQFAVPEERPEAKANLDGPWATILRELARYETAADEPPIGIELYRQVVDVDRDVSNGHFYHVLARLVDDGYVGREERNGSSYYYSITADGRDLLVQEAEWLAAAVGKNVTTGGDDDGSQ